jgi:hypothetical protein
MSVIRSAFTGIPAGAENPAPKTKTILLMARLHEAIGRFPIFPFILTGFHTSGEIQWAEGCIHWVFLLTNSCSIEYLSCRQ